MTVTEYREQKKEQAKQLAKHTKGDLVDKLLFAYGRIKRLETKLQNTSYNSDYAECCEATMWFKEHNFNVPVCVVCGNDLP